MKKLLIGLLLISSFSGFADDHFDTFKNYYGIKKPITISSEIGQSIVQLILGVSHENFNEVMKPAICDKLPKIRTVGNRFQAVPDGLKTTFGLHSQIPRSETELNQLRLKKKFNPIVNLDTWEVNWAGRAKPRLLGLVLAIGHDGQAHMHEWPSEAILDENLTPETVIRPKWLLSESGNPILDKNGNPKYVYDSAGNLLYEEVIKKTPVNPTFYYAGYVMAVIAEISLKDLERLEKGKIDSIISNVRFYSRRTAEASNYSVYDMDSEISLMGGHKVNRALWGVNRYEKNESVQKFLDQVTGYVEDDSLHKLEIVRAEDFSKENTHLVVRKLY